MAKVAIVGATGPTGIHLERAKSAGGLPGRFKVSVVTGDVRKLHVECALLTIGSYGTLTSSEE
jgi:hypothetical protein